jgi:hypothetical protein
MRTLLAGIFAFLPLIQAQDSLLLKSVEPRYDKYDEGLATDFDVASASVTLTVLASGKPFELYKSSVPLPMAVLMALKEYEFLPQGAFPHGRPETEAATYLVTLNVPIRQSKQPREPQSAIRVNPGIAKGLLVRQVRPEYTEYMRHNRMNGTITFEALITKQGEVEILKIGGDGPFVLIEAAYDAVKQWQYRPYLLNGEPVEFLEDIQVSFR